MSELFASHFFQARLHLLNYCGLALIASIGSISFLPLWAFVAVIISMGVFAAILKCHKWEFLFVLAIYSMGAIRYCSIIKNHQVFIERFAHTSCSVKGTVVSIENQEGGRTKQKITIRSKEFLLPDNTTYKAEKTIQIYLTKHAQVCVADEIEVFDFRLKKNSTESYDNYLIKENIAATVFLTSFNYTLIHRPYFSFSRSLFYFKQNLLFRCKKKLSRTTFAFFASVFLGNKNFDKKHMENPKDSCRAWGISHYLARSGLHMVIFICIWLFLLNLIPLPFELKQMLLLAIGGTYHTLSWPSISFLRAFMSFLLYKLCNLFQVPIQLLHLLTLVTILVLLQNPMQLFFLDFQLSFGLTFALAWFNQISTQKTVVTAKY